VAQVHQIQAPNHCGRYELEFGQRCTYRDGRFAFQRKNQLKVLGRAYEDMVLPAFQDAANE